MTPHNVHVEGHFAVVLAGTVAGSLAEFDAPEVTLSCPVDVELATEAVVALHDDGLPVVGASFGANDPCGRHSAAGLGSADPAVVHGRPHRAAGAGGRWSAPRATVSLQDHVRAGQALARAADASGKRVALIASADHGHAHDPDGPYGFDPAAAELRRA